MTPEEQLILNDVKRLSISATISHGDRSKIKQVVKMVEKQEKIIQGFIILEQFRKNCEPRKA